MMLAGLTEDFAAAIARFEGFLSGASQVAVNNNNPGNLTGGPNCTQRDSRGFCVYSSVDLGWSDLYHQITLNENRGLTPIEFFCGKSGVYAGYAPDAGGNNCTQYGNTVAQQLGLDPNVPINQQETPPVYDPTTGEVLTPSDSSVPSWALPAALGVGLLAVLVAVR